MSLSTNVSNLATRVATEIKSVRTLVNGNASDLSSLTTTDKTNLVAALNELNAAIGAIDLTDVINDAATATTTTWSSTKITSSIDAAVSALVDGAPELLDTLNELAAALGDDEDFATTIGNQIALKADDTAVVHVTGDESIAGVKTFTSAPVVPDDSFAIAKVDGLQSALDLKANSADVGDTATNYVTTFEAGLV